MLHYETVTPYLRNTLARLMSDPRSLSLFPLCGVYVSAFLSSHTIKKQICRYEIKISTI